MGASTVGLTIAFTDPTLNEEEKDQEVQKLRRQISEFDDVEVSQVRDPNPPDKSKAAGGFLVGLLTAEVSLANVKTLLGFLGDRLSNKPIELEVEANGKKLKLTASSREELEAAIQAAQEFVAA